MYIYFKIQSEVGPILKQPRCFTRLKVKLVHPFCDLVFLINSSQLQSRGQDGPSKTACRLQEGSGANTFGDLQMTALTVIKD